MASPFHRGPATPREFALYVLGRSVRTNERSPLKTLRVTPKLGGPAYGLTAAQIVPMPAGALDLGCSIEELRAGLTSLSLHGMARETEPGDLIRMRWQGSEVWVAPETAVAFGQNGPYNVKASSIGAFKKFDNLPSLYQLMYHYQDLLGGLQLLGRS